MTADNNHSLCLVVGYDFSEGADLAVGRSLAMARLYLASSLHVLTAIPDGLARLSSDLPRVEGRDTAADELRDKLILAIADKVATMRGAVDRSQSHNINVHTRIGAPDHVIVDLAREVCADLVVVGTHERSGVGRLVPGSVSEHVVREAPCPVLVVREPDYPRESRALPEPPCPRCVAVRHLGDAWWCEVHAELEGSATVYDSPLRLSFERDIERLRRKAWVVN